MCFEEDISVREAGLQPFPDLTLLKCAPGSDRSDFPREFKVSGPVFVACPIASDRSGAPKPAGAFSLSYLTKTSVMNFCASVKSSRQKLEFQKKPSSSFYGRSDVGYETTFFISPSFTALLGSWRQMV